jgi:hypothetical protein
MESIELLKFIAIIEVNFETKLKKKFIDKQMGVLPITLVNTHFLKSITNFKPKINIDNGVKKYF